MTLLVVLGAQGSRLSSLALGISLTALEQGRAGRCGCHEEPSEPSEARPEWEGGQEGGGAKALGSEGQAGMDSAWSGLVTQVGNPGRSHDHDSGRVTARAIWGVSEDRPRLETETWALSKALGSHRGL